MGTTREIREQQAKSKYDHWDMVETKDIPKPLPSKSKYEQIGAETGKLVAEKNLAYGDSFAKTGDFMKLLYPEGIKPSQYKDALLLVRMFDKMVRIATDKDAFGESPFRDLCGYSILGVANSEKVKDNV